MIAPILVTGAPGNVWTPLVHELIRLGAAVRVAAWNVHAARAAFGESVEMVPFEYTDPTTFDAFSGIDRMSYCGRRPSPTSTA